MKDPRFIHTMGAWRLTMTTIRTNGTRIWTVRTRRSGSSIPIGLATNGGPQLKRRGEVVMFYRSYGQGREVIKVLE